MAKVMISLPDELLASVDADAERRGMTRSAVLRAYAEDALRRRAERRAAEIEEIVKDAPRRPRGGRGVDELKRLRPEP